MHWADVIAEDLLRRGHSHKIATGISPSGHIHLGNLREMVIADAVKRALEDAGGDAKIVYVADDLDPLRRRYPFLPKEYENYVGMPLCKIPDPEDCHESYSEHFLQPFLESLEILGIEVEVVKASEMYRNGLYDEAIKIALNKRDEIAKIIEEVTGRELEADWNPFMPLCDSCGRINSAKVKRFDEKWIYYECPCGFSGRAGYREGKLTWRVDWAARWKILGITCEPFGKDHAAAGGSYDTGKRISKEVFGYEPPYPIPYEWVHLKGVGAMKSSKGIVIPVREMIEVLPPEIVRYIVIRAKPERHIEFDPGLGLLDIIDEFEEKVRQEDRSIQLSIVEDVEYSEVPFRHLVVIGQIANWNLEKVLEILRRTGYEIDEITRRDVERRLRYAKNWLEKYAPDRLKFSIPERVEIEFDEDERKFLELYANRLREDMNAEDIHNLVYSVARELKLKPSKAFQAIYKVILGKDYGPRAGYFIKSLGIEWFKNRVSLALEAS